MFCAINTTTIKVTFNTEVTAEAAAKANFTLSKGTLEAANKTGEKEVTLSVAGLTYEDKVTVTVANPSYTQETKVPAINELYTLVVGTDAENDTIKSDGASMTMLTAKLIENATGNVVVEDAQVQFTTTLGSLSQPQVALVNGEASTQLRSTSSATSLTAVVNATIATAPGATQYVGLTGQKIISFTPDGTSEGSTEMVSAVSAGADQGDRFYVTFSAPISADDYKSVVKSTTWTGDATKAPYGVQYKGAAGVYKNTKIVDVVNLTEDTLMFILDTDKSGSIAPTVAAGSMEMMDAAFTGTSTDGNFLRDNVNHTIKFPDNITDLVVNSSELTFMSSDVTKPFIYGVEAKDVNGNDSVLAVTVRASEALAQTLTEGTDNAINGNFSIDGQDIKLMTGTVSTIDVLNAKNNNQLIATSLYVGEYDATKELKDRDNRQKVYITLHKEFKLAPGNHGIQIANIGDLAGETDSPANKVTTQTFPFTVEADNTIPTATVIPQSPEQWIVEFDRPVDSITGKDIEDALTIYTKEGYAASTKVPLVMNQGSGANDYKVSIIDEDGVAISADLATNAQLSGVERLLVEFNQDWSVALKGNSQSKDNYWKSDINPFKVVVKDVESQTGVDMIEKTYDVAPGYDGTSPTIESAQDLFEKTPDKAFRGISAAQNSSTGKYVYVKMSEPVQLVEDVAGTVTAVSNPVTPNLAQDPTQTTSSYNNVAGLSVATYRFVKGDKTVYGNVQQLAEDDQSFVIKPKTDLEAGEWMLYIEQISDDHGNTSSTESKKVIVPQSESADTDTKVSWAAFDNNEGTGATDYDYLYVKFTEKMKANTANGVDKTTNYKFRGYDLPEGSQVFKGIDGLTDDWDAVTIRMPKGAWDGLATNYTTNMSVASNFESANGEKISGDMQFELTNFSGGSSADKDGILAANKFEAVYKNTSATLVAGTPVISVSATDTQDDTGAASADGKFDTFTVQLSENNVSAIATTDKYYINGKEYNPTAAQVAGNSNTLTLKPANATDQVAGTDIRTATLTTSDNVLISSKVKNEAVIVSAVLNAAKDKLTVTFSEAVTNNSASVGSFAPVTAALTFTDNAPTTGGTTATVVTPVHNVATPNVIEYTVTDGANISEDDTITVSAASIKTLRTGNVVTPAQKISNGDATPIALSSASVVQTNASKAMLAAGKAFTVDIKAGSKLAGTFGNTQEVAIVAAAGNTAKIEAAYAVDTININVKDAGTGTATLNDIKTAVENLTVNGEKPFTVNVGVNGANTIAEADAAAAAFTGGQDVITVNFSEAYESAAVANGIDTADSNTDFVIGTATITATSAKTDADTVTITVTVSDEQIKGAKINAILNQITDKAGNAASATNQITIN